MVPITFVYLLRAIYKKICSIHNYTLYNKFHEIFSRYCLNLNNRDCWPYRKLNSWPIFHHRAKRNTLNRSRHTSLTVKSPAEIPLPPHSQNRSSRAFVKQQFNNHLIGPALVPIKLPVITSTHYRKRAIKQGQ